ncbi:MAG: calcium-binding protein [Pseudomonadota bacterium]
MDQLFGGSGQDRLFGGASVDTVDGGSGDDTFTVNTVNDRVIEAADGGRDRVIVTANRFTLPENVEVMSNRQDDVARTLFSSSGGGSLVGNTAGDSLVGIVGDDVAFGGLGDDALFGGGGDDTLRGRSGSDVITGGRGDDLLDGQGDQDAPDLLYGGKGQDVLIFNSNDTAFGGSGADLFGFNGDETGSLVGDSLVPLLVFGDFQGAKSIRVASKIPSSSPVVCSKGRPLIWAMQPFRPAATPRSVSTAPVSTWKSISMVTAPETLLRTGWRYPSRAANSERLRLARLDR